MPVIATLRRPRQEDCCEFKAIQIDMSKSLSQKARAGGRETV